MIIPNALAAGLISALHLRLGHPTKTQFKKSWGRYVFAINSEKFIDGCTQSCSLCTSLKSLPRELFKQSTSQVPDTIGKVFSADIIPRENQEIMVLFDVFSSFVVGQLLPNEQHDTLQQSLIQLSSNYKHPDGCIIRVDNAPGFLAIRDDKLLQSVGIELDFGRVKNKNPNPFIDKAIQEVENELKRMAPTGGQITPGTLAIAISNMNSRIRFNGLSSKEILLKRDNFTNENLDFNDKQIGDFRYTKRLQNHPHIERSKSRGVPPASNTIVSVGDIVHIETEGSNHKARDYYLVVSVNYGNMEASIQKFCGNQLRAKRYLVKLAEVFFAASQFIQPTRNRDDECDGISLDNENPGNVDVKSESDSPPGIDLRRSNRKRNPPDWLARNEIGRYG